MLYCTVYSQECDTTRTLTVNQSLLRNHGHWTLGWVKFSEWKKQVVVVDKLINFFNRFKLNCFAETLILYSKLFAIKIIVLPTVARPSQAK